MLSGTPRTFTGSTTFRIDGMTCAHCRRAVTEEITAVTGVESVTVDLPSGTVTVTGDAAAQQALADAGTQIQAAQRKFDEFAKSSYTQGSGVASMASFLGSSGPDDVLDRAQVLLLRLARPTADAVPPVLQAHARVVR